MTKYNLNSNLVPLFSGTYETMWEVCEYDDNGNEYSVSYEQKNLMQSIVEAYQDNEDQILSELQEACPWIKGIKFTGDFASPRQYNYSTDVIDFTLEVNKSALKRVIKSLEGNAEFNNWLRDNFATRSGFWSYTPDNYSDLANSLIYDKDDSEQSLGALIQWLCRAQNGHDGELESIEYIARDTWMGNGYMGLEYTVDCGKCYEPMQYDRDLGEYVCKHAECKSSK